MLSDKSDPSIHVGIPLYPTFDSLDVLGPYQVFTLSGQIQPFLIGPAPGAITQDVVNVVTLNPDLDDPQTAAEQGYVQSFEGVRIQYDYTYGDDATVAAVKPHPDFDVLFVPGGPQPQIPLYMGNACENPYMRLLQDFAQKLEKEQQLEEEYPDRPKRSEKMFVSSVCVGSLLLAAAGLLDGYRATTHWAFRPVLNSFPLVDVAAGYPRYVIDASRMTGGGISSGIDQALALVAILLGNDTAKRVQLGMQYAPNPPFQGGDPGVAEPTILHLASQGSRPLVTEAQEAFSNFVRSGYPETPGSK